MAILKEVDKPGSDVENYVMKLDKVLIKKIDMMNDLRRQLLDFYKNIKTEEQMAKLFHEMQVPSENSLEDLNTPNQWLIDETLSNYELSILKFRNR